MSNRMVRVNSLVLREISHIIHTEFQVEATSITITEVDIMSDLRHGKAYYSVIGNEEDIRKAKSFFRKNSGRIRYLMGKAIVLKYTPEIFYHYDDSLARGAQLIDAMFQVEEEDLQRGSSE
jgi:ribosome-binding factor A